MIKLSSLSHTPVGEPASNKTPRASSLASLRWQQALETALADNSVCRAIRDRQTPMPLSPPHHEAPPVRMKGGAAQPSRAQNKALDPAPRLAYQQAPLSMPPQIAKALPLTAQRTGLLAALARDSPSAVPVESRLSKSATSAAAMPAMVPREATRFKPYKLTLYTAGTHTKIWLRDLRLTPAQVAKLSAELNMAAQQYAGALDLLVINGVVIQQRTAK